MLNRIRALLGYHSSVESILAPLNRMQANLERFADSSRTRADNAMNAHVVHIDNHMTATAILGNLRRLTTAA